MNYLQPQQSDLEALIDQRDYLNELLKSGEITDIQQKCEMLTAVENIDIEIKNTISWK